MILKRLIPILLVVPLLAACPSGNPNGKMPVDVSKLPRQIYSGEQGPFHVQGIAGDLDLHVLLVHHHAPENRHAG